MIGLGFRVRVRVNLDSYRNPGIEENEKKRGEERRVCLGVSFRCLRTPCLAPSPVLAPSVTADRWAVDYRNLTKRNANIGK